MTLLMIRSRSENSASAAELRATTTISEQRAASANSFLKISRRRRLILFLVTAFPTFLLTTKPSLLCSRPLGCT